MEGATIRFRMRGTNGAIERVKLTNEKIEHKVIADEKPKGICGSGIIDVVAEMNKVNLNNKDGRLLSAENYLSVCHPKDQEFANNLKK